MKVVQLAVYFTVSVPDNVDVEDLFLHIENSQENVKVFSMSSIPTEIESIFGEYETFETTELG